MPDTAPTEFEIVEYDEDDDTSAVLGRLALGTDGTLSVSGLSTPARSRVEQFVALTNAKPGLHIDVPAPPDSPDYAVASRFVGRDDPEFVDALREHADKYYGWALEDL